METEQGTTEEGRQRHQWGLSMKRECQSNTQQVTSRQIRWMVGMDQDPSGGRCSLAQYVKRNLTLVTGYSTTTMKHMLRVIPAS